MIVEAKIFKPLESLDVHVNQSAKSNPDAQENNSRKVDGDICTRTSDVLIRMWKESFDEKLIEKKEHETKRKT